VSLDGQYAAWVGTLVRPDTPILLITEPGRLEEAVMRLARVGYENVIAVLEGGIERWNAEGLPVSATGQTTAVSLAGGTRRVLDVRRTREWDDGHLPGARNVPLAQLADRAAELDREAEWAVVCASGYRSSIAASVLERAGFTRVVNVTDGMEAYFRAGLPVESAATAKA
jgi:rhodanese-related sulfurtransferase